MTSPVVYGIRNCDSIKKSRNWMVANNIDYRFHDYRVDGIDKNHLSAWCDKVDWEILLNQRSTSWRKLSTAQRENIDRSMAIALMCEQPALVKRPVLELGDELLVGFDADRYRSLLLRAD